MLEKTDSKLFTFLLGASALLVAAAAAIFSVTGLSMLYSGEMLYVAIAMGVLEFAKIITASYLYRYWKMTGWGLKTYLSIAVLVLMLVTSGGIYGYLTNSYQGATIGLDKINSQTQVLEQRKLNFTDERERLKVDLESLRSERRSILDSRAVEIRTNDESTDSLAIKYRSYRNRKVREQYKPELDNIDTQIAKYMVDLDSTNVRLSNANDNIANQRLDLIDTGVDVGPLVYMARIFNTTMDNIMKWFTLVIVFVFDPLAIALIIAYNAVVMSGKREVEYEIGVDVAKPGDYSVEFEDEDDEIILGVPDDLSFMKDAKPVKQAFDDLQHSIDDFVEEQKVEKKRSRFSKPNVKKEVPDLVKPLAELVDDIKKESTKDIVVPNTDILEDDALAKAGYYDKHFKTVQEPVKIDDTVSKVKHQNEFFDKMRDDKKDEKDFEAEVKKKKTMVTDEDIRNFFDDAVRKVKKDGQGTITRTPFQAGGSVNVGHIEDDPDIDYSIKE